MGILPEICCIISEHLFLRTPVDGCLYNLQLFRNLISNTALPIFMDIFSTYNITHVLHYIAMFYITKFPEKNKLKQ